MRNESKEKWPDLAEEQRIVVVHLLRDLDLTVAVVVVVVVFAEQVLTLPLLLLANCNFFIPVFPFFKL